MGKLGSVTVRWIKLIIFAMSGTKFCCILKNECSPDLTSADNQSAFLFKRVCVYCLF